MLKGDWDGLVGRLNEAGFHVFRFDWRGHGGSTDITDPLGDGTNLLTGFWTNRITGPFNQRYVKGWGKKPAKNDIRVKTDIANPGYFPLYVNDLAAVRLHLDQKNDLGQLNTSSIYLIGAGDTAALGFLWLAAEWQRPGVAPMLPNGLQYKCVPESNLVAPDPPAGGDIAGAVWLSGSRPAAISEPALKDWVANAPKLRDNNKMLFLYGGTDTKAKGESEAVYQKALVADGNKSLGVAKIDQTYLFPIAKTQLNGISLLGKDVDTKVETKILEYLASRQKDRVTMVRKERRFVTPYYIDVKAFGLRP
jgi:pimeloyl-ACP methyl ester carboxylesterase